MLTAVQGIIQGNTVLVDDVSEIKPFDGRTVTIIINDSPQKKSKQDKSKFFAAAGKINIDKDAVNELRSAYMI